jgi:broad specificity phosphatase PhoE
MKTSHAQSATAPADTDLILDEHGTDESNNPSLAPFTVRLHLIRHGETEANIANLVLGQGDSPLTQNGLDVAARAAASNLINGRTRNYWRMYCSDLHRAHRTARIVLGIEDVHGNILDSSINLVVDSRLRELAKGAREGYLKSLSYEEALEQRSRDADGKTIQVPLLESINDAWERVKGWIDSLVLDAFDDFNSLSDDQKTQYERDVDAPKIYDVFALSHSALIRTMIHKMVDGELPSDYAKTREGSLSIPNLSVSTIDVRPYGGGKHASWRPSLVRLTDVSHLNSAASSVSGPPHL